MTGSCTTLLRLVDCCATRASRRPSEASQEDRASAHSSKSNTYPRGTKTAGETEAPEGRRVLVLVVGVILLLLLLLLLLGPVVVVVRAASAWRTRARKARRVSTTTSSARSVHCRKP